VPLVRPPLVALVPLQQPVHSGLQQQVHSALLPQQVRLAHPPLLVLSVLEPLAAQPQNLPWGSVLQPQVASVLPQLADLGQRQALSARLLLVHSVRRLPVHLAHLLQASSAPPNRQEPLAHQQLEDSVRPLLVDLEPRRQEDSVRLR